MSSYPISYYHVPSYIIVYGESRILDPGYWITPWIQDPGSPAPASDTQALSSAIPSPPVKQPPT